MGEVEQGAGGHHCLIAVTLGLDSSQESSIYGLDLTGNSWSHAVTPKREQLFVLFVFSLRSSD